MDTNKYVHTSIKESIQNIEQQLRIHNQLVSDIQSRCDHSKVMESVDKTAIRTGDSYTYRKCMICGRQERSTNWNTPDSPYKPQKVDNSSFSLTLGDNVVPTKSLLNTEFVCSVSYADFVKQGIFTRLVTM